MNQMFVSSLIVQKKETLIGCFTTFNLNAPIGTKEFDFQIKLYQFGEDNTQRRKNNPQLHKILCVLIEMASLND